MLRDRTHERRPTSCPPLLLFVFWQERTVNVLVPALEALGCTVQRVAGTGLVVDIPGRSDDASCPVIALRADLDALPITEGTGLDFASTVDGVMHACGHDGHTAMLYGAAELLMGLEEAPPCPVRLLWQPAEEQSGGATSMIAAGALDNVCWTVLVHNVCDKGEGG